MKVSLPLFIVLLFFSTKLLAQDSLFLKNGNIVDGKLRIQYSIGNDIVEVGGKSYSATDIDSVIVAGSTTLYSHRVVYYHRERRLEITKSVLLEQVLKGTVKLYKYSGRGFELVVQKGNAFQVLQTIPNDAKLDKSTDYKSALLTVFGNKVDRQEVFKLDLNENAVVHVINKYNGVMNKGYTSEKKSEARYREISLSFSYGKNYTPLNYDYYGSNTYLAEVFEPSFISLEDDWSATLEKNIGYSKNWFYLVGVTFRQYLFIIDEDFEDGELVLRSDEIVADMGITYRLNRPILTPEGSFGISRWRYHGTLDYDKYQVFSTQNEKGRAQNERGWAVFLKGKLNYQVTPIVAVFLQTKLIWRTQKQYFSYYTDVDYDNMRYSIIPSIGIKLYNVKDGIF